MSSVLDAKALQASPLADLYLLANELGVDGYRRLRKADLVAAIIARQSGEEAATPSPAEEVETPSPADEVETPAARASDSDGPGRDEPAEAEEPTTVADSAPDGDSDEEDSGRRGRRGRRGGRTRGRGRDEDGSASETPDAGASAGDETATPDEDLTADGIVELLPNGSGFLRLSSPDAGEGDVYISAAQVKRCELVAGDRVSGPVRKPRNSERYPSLVRVDQINGRPADEISEGVRYEDRPVKFPDQRLNLAVEDPTVRAIEWLTPFGRGSRVIIVGSARAGKTEALRRVAGALAAQGEVELILALSGVRPEEISEWSTHGLPAPVAVAPLGSSPDVQAQAVEQAVEQGRRIAARGGDAVLVLDSLAQLPVPVARRALATARNLVDGGSLTVLATATEPFGGETSVISLDATLTGLGRFPALDLSASGSMRPELLVGDEGAQAITRARTEALA